MMCLDRLYILSLCSLRWTTGSFCFLYPLQMQRTCIRRDQRWSLFFHSSSVIGTQPKPAACTAYSRSRNPDHPMNVWHVVFFNSVFHVWNIRSEKRRNLLSERQTWKQLVSTNGFSVDLAVWIMIGEAGRQL